MKYDHIHSLSISSLLTLPIYLPTYSLLTSSPPPHSLSPLLLPPTLISDVLMFLDVGPFTLECWKLASGHTFKLKLSSLLHQLLITSRPAVRGGTGGLLPSIGWNFGCLAFG